MVGKLGLVGGVATAWLLTFVLMGGDVMPAISGNDAKAASDASPTASYTPRPPATASAAPQAVSTADPADATSPNALTTAAATAEQVAQAQPLAGQTLVDRPGPRRSAPPVVTFRMSSFNMLGSSHTRGTRKRAPGTARASRAAEYVLSNDLEVVGFQEMQRDQRAAFTRATGGRYGLYPGDQLRSLDGENSIAYRLDTWELVKADSVAIPYFDGRPRNMPVLLLKNRKTGITAYFANFHNPADTARYGGQARWRAAATAREVALFSDLRDDGYPLFVTGDMNEKQSWFCSVAGPGDLQAAAAVEFGQNGCTVPGFRIDWIAGSQGVQFSNYREDKSGLVAWMTDHPVMMTDVTIDSSAFPRSVLN